jgi:hypothetical protein
MRGGEATLPPQFSLLRSEFNEFLYAPIGAESNDSVLSVLSALARTGIDPWQEAARLAQLSKALATQRLTAIIAGLPDGQWAQTETGAIAARLIELLPAKGVAPSASPSLVNAKRVPSSLLMKLLLVVVLGGSTLFAILNHLNPAPVINQESSFSTTPASPFAPVTRSKQRPTQDQL